MANSLFREEAVENQKDKLHGDVLVLPSFPHVVILSFLLIWVIALVSWLLTSSYARQETVTGWLEPPSGVVRVYAEDSVGRIKKVLVQEGQKVTSGQPLVVINGDRMLASGDNLEAMLLDEYIQQQDILNKQLIRTSTTFKVRQRSIEQQIASSQDDLEKLSEQIDTLEQRHGILQRRVAHSSEMNQKGHISDIEYEAAIEQELEIRSDKQALLRARVNQQSRVEQLETQLELMPQEQQDSAEQIKSNLSNIALRVAQLHGDRAYIVKATRSGIVTNLQTREGLKADIDTPLLTIVPEDSENEVRLMIPVRAAGFIEVGQPIRLRFDAFPYQKFGLYSGSIKSISDSLLLPNEINSLPLPINEAVYLVIAQLDQDFVMAYDKPIKLKSGMTLSADIRLENRSLVEWLLEPVYSLKGRM